MSSGKRYFPHAADVAVLPRADERQKILRLHRQSAFAEHGHRRRVDERLGVRQHPIHVETMSNNLILLGVFNNFVDLSGNYLFLIVVVYVIFFVEWVCMLLI